jgi:hypothetical protein
MRSQNPQKGPPPKSKGTTNDLIRWKGASTKSGKRTKPKLQETPYFIGLFAGDPSRTNIETEINQLPWLIPNGGNWPEYAFPGVGSPDKAIVQRDDGLFAVGWQDDAAGPFESRRFAEAVAAQGVSCLFQLLPPLKSARLAQWPTPA